MLKTRVIESQGFSINDDEKAWGPKYLRKSGQQLHRASYVKINSKKTKDLNKKTWTDEIVKENRNASKDWKGERFILFYPISRSTENISKKKIYILHEITSNC